MQIYIIHQSRIEGAGLSSLLQKEGYQVKFSSNEDCNISTFDETTLLLLDTNSLSLLKESKVRQLQTVCNSVTLIGRLSHMHWFFQFIDTCRAYICRKENTKQLFTMFNKLDNQQDILSPKTSDFLLKSTLSQQEYLFHHNLCEYLTQTELKIMWEIVRGRTARQIAKKWHRSKHTIYNHRKNIMGKLDLNGTFRLTKFCYNKADSIKTLLYLSRHEKTVEKLTVK